MSDLESLRENLWPPDELLQEIQDMPHAPGYLDYNVSRRQEEGAVDPSRVIRAQNRLVEGILRAGATSIGAEVARLGSPQLERKLAVYRELLEKIPSMSDAQRDTALSKMWNRDRIPFSLVPSPDGGFFKVLPAVVGMGVSERLRRWLHDPGASVPNYRFYLNPPVEMIPEIAGSIVLQNAEHEAYFHFKFVDVRDAVGGGELEGRTDPLVVYTPKSEGDRVLELLRSVKARVPAAFEGRELPRLVLPVEDGIGLAEDPPDGASYTRSRAGLIREARADRGRQEPFRHALARAAVRHSIDSHNIAFNSLSESSQ